MTILFLSSLVLIILGVIFSNANSNFKKTILLLVSVIILVFFNTSIQQLISIVVIFMIIYFGGRWINSDVFLSLLFPLLSLIIIFVVLKILASGSVNTTDFTLRNNLIPLGLSYFIFQGIGYHIDLYFNQVQVRNTSDLFLYLFYSPKLLSGPVERSYDFFWKIEQIKRINSKAIQQSVFLILLGITKIWVVAAIFSELIYNKSSSNDAQLNTDFAFIMASMIYPIKLYFEFSGYTDLVRGISNLLGIDLRINFNLPYLSQSVAEFWRRWHISLSSWFQEYLFTPLTMFLRGKKWSTYCGIFCTFVLLGIWHDISLNFLIFGLIHATFVSLELKFKKVFFRANSIIKTAYLYLIVVVSFVFFRTNSLSEAVQNLSAFFLLPYKLSKGIELSFCNFGVDPLELGGGILFAGVIIFLEVKSNMNWGEFLSNLTFYKRYMMMFALFMIIIFFAVFEQQSITYIQF